jgi:uncharacterized repeat protein (TIGR01451 family)
MSLSMTNRASALSETGIGIRMDGQLHAALGETIEYQVTIFNLGDYWIKNITVTDTLPNGTSRVWITPNLAPQGLPGNSFNLTDISYTIEKEDIPLTDTNSSSIVNQAEAVGYAEVQQLGLLVRAETNFPTFVLTTPVGGYTASIEIPETQDPNATHLFLSPLALELFNTSCGLSEFTILKILARCRCCSDLSI